MQFNFISIFLKPLKKLKNVFQNPDSPIKTGSQNSTNFQFFVKKIEMELERNDKNVDWPIENWIPKIFWKSIWRVFLACNQDEYQQRNKVKNTSHVIICKTHSFWINPWPSSWGVDSETVYFTYYCIFEVFQMHA